MELDKIYNMDCLEGMKNIPDKSVDLIVTDPPYEFETQGAGFHNKRNYYDEIADKGLSKDIHIGFMPMYLDDEKAKKSRKEQSA